MQISEVQSPALEVGCGANGIWRFNDKVLGIDPINYFYLDKNFLCCKAEILSSLFSAREFKDVYCVNALDHMEDPETAMKEMSSMCSDRLVIWSNVFPEHYHINKYIYNPHPHAFTEKQFLKMLPKDFEVSF
jgi:hypothetical protein